jgi:succinylglutamate-semialdehyde dehydrogenase
VEAARRAQRGWEQTPLVDRIARLNAFRAALVRRESELVALIGREVGKPAWEARAEAQALASKVDITIDEGLTLVRGFRLEDGRLETRFRPHGVMAVLGPFNFPLHLAHGHVVPALATGNTVVFKPSEVAPACAQAYAEAAEEAGFPRGVFNLVQGSGASGARLGAHPDVDGVLFTGSYATGVKLLEANAHRPGRMLALELGGKNSALVLADAPFDKAVYDVLYSTLATAGQRCTAVSRVIVERSLADRFIDALLERARRFTCGHPATPGVFHGPLATAAAFEKFHRFRAIAHDEGHETLLESTRPAGLPDGYYATASIHRVRAPSPSSRYEHEEIFGPELAIFVADDLESACMRADATPYGLAAAVFTEDEARFEACAARLRVGCLAWNAPTVGSSSRLPFGGVKHSGNHRPAGLFSATYCAWPQAVSRGSRVFDPARLAPGVHWTD